MNKIETKRKVKNVKVSIKKDKQTNQNISIEILHAKKVEYFKNLQKVVLHEKRKKLEVYEKNFNCNEMSLFDIDMLKQEIKDIETKKEENEYYLNNMEILREYYDYLQEECTNDNIKIFGQKQNISTKKREFFDRYSEINDITNFSSSIKKQDLRRRKRIAEYGTIEHSMICKNCGSFDKIVTTRECHGCTECGVVQGVIITNTVGYNDRTNIGGNTNESVDYKRFNYFKEILLQIQGNELTEIPQILIDNVINELSKENITDFSKITIEKIKFILKKTGNSRYYEHIPRIITKITNNPIIKIDIEVQEKLFYMFKKIDNDFDKHDFGNRINFFSFPYIIHKLFELLDLPEYYPYFPYLDNRAKLNVQDQMWKKIVTGFIENTDNDINNRFDIKWRYIKST